MANGGKRPGAGRKSKAVELGLDSMMDGIGPTEEVLKRLYELATDDKPNTEAMRMWLGYKFGTPKQAITLDSEVEVTIVHES
jgi:hypothetical protein